MAMVVAEATVVELDPGQVAQHPGNVRDASRGIEELAASIADVGVLVPLIVVPVDQVDGYGKFPKSVTHVAVDGNRRQRAAAKAGVKLPCLVRPDLAAARDTVRTMAVTALVRDGFTPLEEIRATQLLLDFDMSEESVARSTGRPVERVRQARAAAGLPGLLQRRAQEAQLDLETFAAVAEFEDDAPAVQRIFEAFERQGTAAYEVAELRRQRAVKELMRQTTEELEAKGITVRTGVPGTGWDLKKPTALQHLCSSEGKKITALTHQKCPGHAVTLIPKAWTDPPSVDRAAVCVDPAKHGHERLSDHTGDIARDVDQDEPSEGQRPDELAEARAEAEAQRAAREEALAQWAASRDVRREFLRSVVARKELPPDAFAWALASTVRRTAMWWDFEDTTDKDTLPALLGVDPDDVERYVTAEPPNRHPALLWAMVVDSYERELAKHWRLNSPYARHAEYFAQLEALGYTPSEVEQSYAARAGDLARINAAGEQGDDEDENADWEPDSGDED